MEVFGKIVDVSVDKLQPILYIEENETGKNFILHLIDINYVFNLADRLLLLLIGKIESEDSCAIVERRIILEINEVTSINGNELRKIEFANSINAEIYMIFKE